MPHLRSLESSEIEDSEILERFEYFAKTHRFTPNSNRTLARTLEPLRAARSQAMISETGWHAGKHGKG